MYWAGWQRRRRGARGGGCPGGRKGGGVAGSPILPSVSAAPQPVDLAVILVPAGHILPALEDCGRAGVRGVVISSGGFSEDEGSRGATEAARLAGGRCPRVPRAG